MAKNLYELRYLVDCIKRYEYLDISQQNFTDKI